MIKKTIYFVVFVLSILSCSWRGSLSAQTSVSQAKMEEIYEEIKTPYKYGLAIAPTTNNYKIDCPSVFRKGDKWYMTYLIYNGKTGKDGRGYQTWLAQSDDLLHWKTLGKILSFREKGWDKNQRGGFVSLEDNEWGGSYELNKFKNKYWMTYIGGENPGYETGPLKIGLAFTDSDPANPHEWKSLNKPIMSPEDKDAQWFEKITQYKSSVFWDKSKMLGKRFVMFYNAAGINPKTKIKAERIGIALSDDMVHWNRYKNNPIFSHEEGITGDAHIQKMGDVYVMFYFSAFRSQKKYKAFNTFACSYDLINWTEWNGKDLVIPSKNYDNLFAHKSSVVKYNGIVYHFYCAVNEYNQRGIAIAVSKPLGRSDVHFPEPDQQSERKTVSLNDNWQTVVDEENSNRYDAFNVDNNWINVNLPHNWDDYGGYRQLLHGNRHGNAWYTKKFFLPDYDSDKHFFIRFDGVGTYATVYINGNNLGRYFGGRTTFTIDVSNVLKKNAQNILEVKVEHPSFITDMPWVCGGCSSEVGFSEGSQPFGIFRPVTLEITDKVRIEPFGVHIWNVDTSFVHLETEIKNYSSSPETFELVNKLNDDNGIAVFRLSDTITLQPGEIRTVKQIGQILHNLHPWSIENPYLYQLSTLIKREGEVKDELLTPYGIRTVSWPVKRNDGDPTFRLNGRKLFINGVCEYEHLFGQSHAFSEEQILSRVNQIKDAGFNAFRDAHQPHNLSYQKYFDKYGILSWPQFSAHIWYDTPEFKNNFKNLLRQWVKERRNSPSIIMWGLQNESVLPKAFAEECADIIREMDPTTQDQRIITTCNGGEGTDWNVPQNWSGTYGGNPDEYDAELKKQLLNGEYGAWRSIDFHSEGNYDSHIWSEDNMCSLLEKKIRLAESVKDSICGHFLWLFNSHDNPGRKQPDEGCRIIDKIGPVNYKGLQTSWGEPVDAYYLYKSNYVSPQKEPMVYIVSHTWTDRWQDPGIKNGIKVYSNCDEVELFNDVKTESLGKLKKGTVGTHFEWNNVNIKYNVLYAIGYVNGKVEAEDCIILDHLPQAPHFDRLYQQDVKSILCPENGYYYLYRVNCGGDAYTDELDQKWLADRAKFADSYWGSVSWTNDFEKINAYQGSQRFTKDPIKGTKDWPLFETFRYGRHKLSYYFPLPDGEYRIELYFIEPWYGTGSNGDFEGQRIFDVAINDSVYIDDLDIWAEAGHDVALKKVVNAKIKGGSLRISFPQTKVGQAIISAIAIASKDSNIKLPLDSLSDNWSWNNINRIKKTPLDSLPESSDIRPINIYKVDQTLKNGRYKIEKIKNQTFVAFQGNSLNSIEWNFSVGVANKYLLRFDYMNMDNNPKNVKIKIIGTDGTIYKNDILTFPTAKEKRKNLSTDTGGYINAGHYKVQLSSDDMDGLWFGNMTVQ